MSQDAMHSIRSEILLNPSVLRDPACHNEVLAYIDELKASTAGWQMCVEWLTSGEIQDEHVQFLGLQIIEFYLKNNYSKAAVREQDIVRRFLSNWIQNKCGQLDSSEPVFIRNKAAQLFALVCIQDFPNRWPTFFSDLIDTLSVGPKAADNFLRVLKAVDTEVLFIEVHTRHWPKHCMKRTLGLDCVEPSLEKRCCRYTLTVDFEEFGWDWIIAPKKYEANFCSGECPYDFLQKHPHTHLAHMAHPTGTVGPCCALRKLSAILMLYLDNEFSIIYVLLPDMVVDLCGCS